MKIAVFGTGHGRPGTGRQAVRARPPGHGGNTGSRGDSGSNGARLPRKSPVRRLARGVPRTSPGDGGRRRGRRRADRERDQRRRLDRDARVRGQGQPRGKGSDRHRQPARLLPGPTALALRFQHRLARRADPARVPGHQSGEGAEHDELRGDGRPGHVPGEHDVFLSGEDADAKRQVGELLESFGWPAEHIRDLGGISSARGTEMYVALWLRLWGALGTGYFNIHVVQ
jgi:hypothetical protein